MSALSSTEDDGESVEKNAVVACSVTGGAEVVEVLSVVPMFGSLHRCHQVTICVLNETRTLAWDERSVFF